MTAQAHDVVRLGDAERELAGVDGGPLVDLAAHGIVPGGMSTACRRGHRCFYAVAAERLLLTELWLGDGAGAGGRPVADGDALFGGTVAAASGATSRLGAAFVLRDLAWPVPFTGRMLLARDLVSPGPRAGFAPAWRFADVVELTISAGAVTALRDVSGEMSATRRAIEAGEAADPDGPVGGTAWTARTLSLGYDRSFPR